MDSLTKFIEFVAILKLKKKNKITRLVDSGTSIANDILNTTPMIWGSVYSDDLETWDVTKPTEIKVPVGYTKMRLAFHVEFPVNNVGVRACRLKINGGVAIFSDKYVNLTQTVPAIDGITTHIHCCGLETDCDAGDILTIEPAQNSGGALNLIGAGSWVICEWFN